MDKIILDLETQKEFSEVGGRNNMHLLKVSMVGVYSYKQAKFFTFLEDELDGLESLIHSVGQVIGFNIRNFDYLVLQPYFTKLSLLHISTLDIMEEIQRRVGYRVSLESVARATLKESKSGHGLLAIKFFKEGDFDSLEKYCLDDVRLTRDIYEYGVKHGKIHFTSALGNSSYSVPVQWR